MRILVVEDEQDMNQIICKKLTADGYSVDQCFDGKEALLYFESTDYDAAILDVMIPYINGFDLLKKIRANGNQTPIIFLTAKDTVDDRVTGLDLGANDYLVKPFSFLELMARLRAMTRKTVNNTTNIYTVSDLTVNISTHSVHRNNHEITLSAKEFSLLEYLIRNKGIVLSREKIETHIWNYDYDGGSNVVDVYIRYLRKKIDDPHQVKLIHTVRGSGYVLKE